MSPRPTPAWIALLCALALTSCAAVRPPVPQVELKDRPAIPAELLTCSDAPAVPEVLPDDAALMRLLGAFEAAWADCRDRLADVLARQRDGRGQ